MVEELQYLWARIPRATGRVVVLGFFFLGAGVVPAVNQESAPPTANQTLRVSTDVVNVYAIVREKKRPVANLGREDFELTEDDVPQQIRYFSRETDTPLTLGIMIDTSPSQERVLGVEQEEAKRFLGQVLRPNDLAFVLHFDLEVELLQDYTSKVSLLARAIDETVIRSAPSGPLPSPFPTPSVGGTHLYDAVYLAARELMKGEVGRKVLILLSDGEDQGSTVKLNSALEAAHKADVIIYSIAVIDRAFYWGRVMGFSGDSVLGKFSAETGGRVIEVKRAGDTGAAFGEIADELRTQYLLGYTPANTRRDGSFRKIRVKVRGRDYKVQARRGYYAPTE
jgi:VWFA-related protein